MRDTVAESAGDALIRARRGQILDAATRVFAAKGFHRATIRDIARDAGIADGTIYNYFENKTALLLGIVDRINETEQREAHFAASAGRDVEQFMREYLRHRLAILTDAGLDVFRVILPEALTNAEVGARYYREIIAPTFHMAEVAAAGWPMDDPTRPDTRLALRAVAGMVLGIVLLRLMGDPLLAEHWDAVPDLLTDLLTHGFVSAQGDDDGATGRPTDANHPA